MSVDTNKLDELIRQSAGNYRVDNTDQDFARFKKKIFKFNFFRFSFFTFNIFYASVAFGMMVIGGYSGYKFVSNFNKMTSLPTQIKSLPADSIHKADTLSKTDTVKSTLIIYKPENSRNPNKRIMCISDGSSDNKIIKKPIADTVKLTVTDTIYKKVKVIVRDTVKIKKRKPK